MEKLPPMQKVFEAYTALVDGRVAVDAGATEDEGIATVSSSDGSKAYRVVWKDGQIASSDNATYWQGYAGYPVIAVLMHFGRLPFDAELARRFPHVAWKRINDTHRRDYAEALDEVFDDAGFSPAERKGAMDEAQRVIDALSKMDLTIRRKL